MTADTIKILLVSESEEIPARLRELLSEVSQTRYSMDCVADSRTAVDAITTQAHDVYFFSNRFSAHSGLDLLGHAKAAGDAVPAIILSPVMNEAQELSCIAAGAEDFLALSDLTAGKLNKAIQVAMARSSAQKELRCMAAFASESSDAVIEFSVDGNLTYSNDAGLRLASTLQKKTLLQVLPAEVGQIVRRCLERGGSKATFQTTIDARTFAWTFVPVRSRQIVHCYGAEITERLNMEEKLRQSLKMEAVGQLAAGVAHDFNNILTVIQGHADLLLHKANTDPQSEQPLKQICLASERAGSLIRQLLMFSRKQVMRHRFLDLNEIVQNLIQVLHRFLGDSVEIEVRLAPAVPTIFGDAGMVEQALINLAVNARDALPIGGRIVISTHLEQIRKEGNPRRSSGARPGEFICLRIADNGTGMDEKTMKRIFEPFFTTKEVGKGTGLGLATAYGIVEQHHGWIDAESTVGKGSTFSIHLPVTEDNTHEKPTAPSRLTEHGGKETILVVEDEPALRLLVVEILQIYGYQVLQASSGLAALSVWEEHKSEIDLLLTDMVMPDGISGRELADRLLRENPRLKIIYTSGYSPGMAGTDTARLRGFNFLPKPYPPSRLAELVRFCLNKKNEQTECLPVTKL